MIEAVFRDTAQTQQSVVLYIQENKCSITYFNAHLTALEPIPKMENMTRDASDMIIARRLDG